MVPGDLLGPLAGAVALGAVHGVEPGHGWPVAASYALDRANRWAYGLAASLLIGVGHLVSSVAMVAVFLYAKGLFDLASVDEPITLLGGVRIGGPVSVVAGVLLVALGVREYLGGHSHGEFARDDDHGHDHSHGNEEEHGHGESHEHEHEEDHSHGHAHGENHEHEDGVGNTLTARLRRFVPFLGGHSHSHGDLGRDGSADHGLLGLAWVAFVLGFAHEEEFEILALCTGSNYCLELMGAYALTVVAGIVGLTMLLVAGYRRHEETVERFAPYLPTVSAVVLVVMGLGFVLGLF